MCRAVRHKPQAPRRTTSQRSRDRTPNSRYNIDGHLAGLTHRFVPHSRATKRVRMKHTREVSMVLCRSCAAEDRPRDLLSRAIQTSKFGKGAAQFDEILIDIANKTLRTRVAVPGAENGSMVRRRALRAIALVVAHSVKPCKVVRRQQAASAHATFRYRDASRVELATLLVTRDKLREANELWRRFHDNAARFLIAPSQSAATNSSREPGSRPLRQPDDVSCGS